MLSWCLQVPPLSFMQHPPFHDEADRSAAACLCSAASFLPYITKVNLFSSLHGLSISRIIFWVSWQFFCVCVCVVRWCVCFRGWRGRLSNVFVTFTSSFNPTAVLILWFVFLSVGDFLSPPAMDPPINKQLSNSSAALHSPERGESTTPSINQVIKGPVCRKPPGLTFFFLVWEQTRRTQGDDIILQIPQCTRCQDTPSLPAAPVVYWRTNPLSRARNWVWLLWSGGFSLSIAVETLQASWKITH